MDISELWEEANKRLFTCLSCCNMSQYRFSCSYCNFLILDKKKKLQMRSFSHVELAYDVDMRRNIPVNILLISLAKEQHTILIIKYCLAGCDTGSAFFGIGKKSVFKRMIQGGLKFQKLKDLGHGPLSNCQKFTCTQFVEVIYEKLDATRRNKLRKGSSKNPIDSFHFHILHSTCPPHK